MINHLNPWNLKKLLSFLTFQQVQRFTSYVTLTSNFHLNLAQFWTQKSLKIGSKINQNRCRFFDWFFIEFYTDLGSILGSVWGVLGRLFGPKRSEVVRLVPVQMRDRWIFASEAPLGSIFNKFWSILDRFGLHFGRPLGGLGATFGSKKERRS